MKTLNYYERLKVSRNATLDEIKKAYRKLSREYHPDLNPSPDANDIMASINEAYETLRDPELRSRYDKMLSTSNGQSSNISNNPRSYNEDLDFEILLKKLIQKLKNQALSNYFTFLLEELIVRFKNRTFSSVVEVVLKVVIIQFLNGSISEDEFFKTLEGLFPNQRGNFIHIQDIINSININFEKFDNKFQYKYNYKKY